MATSIGRNHTNSASSSVSAGYVRMNSPTAALPVWFVRSRPTRLLPIRLASFDVMEVSEDVTVYAA